MIVTADRADRTGLGIAVAGHALLLVVLSLGIALAPKPVPPLTQPVDIQIVDKVGLTDTAPNPSQDEPAASVAPEVGPPVEAPTPPAAPSPAPLPRQTPAPLPAPSPAKPAPQKPAPAQAKPSPAKPTPARPTETARGSRLGNDFLKGITDRQTASTAQSPRVAVGGAEMASLVSAIRRQVQPCADRINSPGPDSNRITTKLNIRLNPNGTLVAAPAVVSQTGVDDDNSRYAKRVGELAASAFVQCAPFELPAEMYEGWKNINLNYKLPPIEGQGRGSLVPLLKTFVRSVIASAAVSSAAPAFAQIEVDVTGGMTSALVIAVPVMPTPGVASTAAGSTDTLGRQVAEVVASDLRGSGLFKPQGPAGVPGIAFAEVTAPQFDRWSGAGAALVQGYVRANPDGGITVGCYLYDVGLRTELTRAGYVVQPSDWRRAAHKCADAIYARLSGESPFFDSRVAYIAETGPKENRVKRLAIMDSDGANHRFLTNGQNIVLTPRFSPDYKSIVYLSYAGKRPRIYIYELGTGRQRLVTEGGSAAFAPRWSPDGRTILYSMSNAGNTDIYAVSSDGGGSPRRLTTAPGINVGGSFSPDGSKIVFESDRSGSQQLYVMNADGSNQHRITFGGGRYATPEWSPRGDLIAFTKMAGNFRIGVITPGGQGERTLTNSWQDEAPTWSPNGRVIQFFRTSQGRGGKSSLWQVDLTGVNERRLPTPVDGSDPTWGPLLP